MKSSVFTFIFLLSINIEYGYSIETKKIVNEKVTIQGKTLLWEFSTFELKKETYVSSFTNNCFVVDNPDFLNRRAPVANEVIKLGMRLIISKGCEIVLFDEDGIYPYKYSDYNQHTFVEIIDGNLVEKQK